ncbi:unnamed protein product [Symbiodinium sp. CCMP2592]|nr:unnamed protein product [Symbiodinium sp. CCMP2592]
MELSELCTIITTTSPTPSNPATELICSTLESLEEFVPELLQCRHIVVCDGYRLANDSKFRSGIVTQERAKAYEQYVASLEIFTKTRPTPLWESVEVLRLVERQGFGFAVRAALELVRTPFVFVMQHDRTFLRGFPHVLSLLKGMLQNPCLKMVGLPTTTNDPTRYVIQAVSRLGQMKVVHPPFESLVVTSSECPSLRFIPMIMWHDSTHFALTSYYREFVFGRRHLVTRGGFIEDKLGQQQGMDLRSIGWSSHEQYGTYLLDDGALAPARMVGHLDGKRYLRQEARIALEASERAKASMSAHADSDSRGPVVDEITRACSCYRQCRGGS